MGASRGGEIMTRDELKQHCIRQIEECEKWARYRGKTPEGKIYEEHKLTLSIIEKLEAIENAIENRGATSGDTFIEIENIIER